MGLHAAHAAHGAVGAGAHRELRKKKATKPKLATKPPRTSATAPAAPGDHPLSSHPSGVG